MSFYLRTQPPTPVPVDEFSLNPQMSLAESQGPSSEVTVTLIATQSLLVSRGALSPSSCNSRLADPLREESKFTTNLSWEKLAWELR